MTPYEILGVDPTATQDEIAKAYRAKSRKLHPDVGGDAAAFAELSHAYEILSDAEKREAFDRGDDLHMQREVESTIAALIAQAIDSNQANIIRWICDKVDRQRANHQNALPATRRKIDHLKAIAERFDRSNKDTENCESRDFIAGCIQGLVANAESALKSEEREIKLGTEMLKYLNGIKYEAGAQSFQSLVDYHAKAGLQARAWG